MITPSAASPARQIQTGAVPEPGSGLFSNCLVAGGVIYLSGQHAGAFGGGAGDIMGGDNVFDQTMEALRRVMALIEAAGGSAKNVVKLTIYLTDMSRKAEVSRARREFFSGQMPCSTLVGVNALVAPGLLVEIDAIAILDP